MSEDNPNTITGHRMPKLTLDSQEDERIEQQQKVIKQAEKLRRQEKRKRKQEAHILAQRKIKEKEELERKYQQPQKMFEEDSNSNDTFSRIQQKIKKVYPNIKRKEQHYYKRSRKHDSFSQQSDSDEEESSQTPVKGNKKKIIEKKVQKMRIRKRSQEEQQKKNYKVRAIDQIQQLANEVAVRWWYVFPQWPPSDYNYQNILKKQGYRIVNPSEFRMQEDVVHGLHKVTPLDGYIGVFKSKNKLIDVRPKDNAPTMNYFQSKTKNELYGLLKQALKKQVTELKGVEHIQNGEKEIIHDLQKRISTMN